MSSKSGKSPGGWGSWARCPRIVTIWTIHNAMDVVSVLPRFHRGRACGRPCGPPRHEASILATRRRERSGEAFAVVHAELAVGVAEVELHRLGRDEKRLRDLPVRHARDRQLGYPPLARRE